MTQVDIFCLYLISGFGLENKSLRRRSIVEVKDLEGRVWIKRRKAHQNRHRAEGKNIYYSHHRIDQLCRLTTSRLINFPIMEFSKLRLLDFLLTEERRKRINTKALGSILRESYSTSIKPGCNKIKDCSTYRSTLIHFGVNTRPAFENQMNRIFEYLSDYRI